MRARLAVALAAVRVSPLQRLEVPAARRRRTRRGVPTGGRVGSSQLSLLARCKAVIHRLHGIQLAYITYNLSKYTS